MRCVALIQEREDETAGAFAQSVEKLKGLGATRVIADAGSIKAGR